MTAPVIDRIFNDPFVFLKRNLFFLLLLFSGFAFGQTITADFNPPDQHQLNRMQAQCWEFNNMSVSNQNNVIHTGGDKSHGEADLGGFVSLSSIISPFINFNNTGTISFSHRLMNNMGFLQFAELNVYLMDPAGNMVSPMIFTHNYSNGNATTVRTHTIPVTWTGDYRVVWEWGSFLANTTARIDDISISGAFAADDGQQVNGYCPAVINTVRDTLCAGEANHAITALFPRTGRSYSWSWVGPSGGTIDANVNNPYDATIQVDWINTPGDYVLHCQESAGGGRPGNQIYYHIHLKAPPSFTFATNTVCEGEVVTVDVLAVGKGPFTIEFTTDAGSQSIIMPGNGTSFNLPEESTFIDFTDVYDADGCSVDPATLGSTPLSFLPAATAGPIYHY